MISQFNTISNHPQTPKVSPYIATGKEHINSKSFKEKEVIQTPNDHSITK